ncbi:nitronate monooxygenase [Aspergillus stella-maris]|uniref:nitronate monooxygenase n=1 Tax=Aspergillus stella-maris TaxID=1810926 RepID=UPI003CCD71FC
MSKRLSELYPWARKPLIISAPMRIMSGPTLAVSVCRAGGLAFLGPGAKTRDTLTDLEEISSLLQKEPFFRNSEHAKPSALLPVGPGFQLWNDNLEVASFAVEKYRPCAAWLFAPQNGQADLNTWSRRLRTSSPGTQIWVQTGTVSEVRSLISNDAERPDVIVVQGSEAGGHGRANDGAGLISLLPEVADLLASSGVNDIPLVAAGGITDGRGALAALCLGASGIAMGTRFLASTEARIASGYQGEIIRANEGASSTTRTLLYNHLRGTYGWPREYSPRTIINKSYIEHRQGKSFDELKDLHDEAAKGGDEGWGPEGRLATYAGMSVGLIRDVKGAGEIVSDVLEYIEPRAGVLLE